MSVIVTSEHKDFPSLTKHAKAIVYLYKLVGLYSVPLLTAVTIVSMTNVFTSGVFAQWSWVSGTWAFVFALAIDVNIVRLFVEAKTHHDRGAFTIGIGLSIATGAALLIEGLQQSIGLSWQNIYVQYVIGGLIALRVVLVIVLMAREGSKLGRLLEGVLIVNTGTESMIESVPVEQPKEVQIDAVPVFTPVTSPVPVEQPAMSNIRPFPVPVKQQKVSSAEDKIRHALHDHPDLSIRALATMIGVSPTTVTNWKKRIENEQNIAVQA